LVIVAVVMGLLSIELSKMLLSRPETFAFRLGNFEEIVV
jgi:hypothetical protein